MYTDRIFFPNTIRVGFRQSWHWVRVRDRLWMQFSCMKCNFNKTRLNHHVLILYILYWKLQYFCYYFILYVNILLHLNFVKWRKKENVFAWLFCLCQHLLSLFLQSGLIWGNQSFPKDQLQCMAGAQFVFMSKFGWIPPWAPPGWGQRTA